MGCNVSTALNKISPDIMSSNLVYLHHKQNPVCCVSDVLEKATWRLEIGQWLKEQQWIKAAIVSAVTGQSSDELTHC